MKNYCKNNKDNSLLLKYKTKPSKTFDTKNLPFVNT